MLHGSALVTRDLDICAVLTPDNVERLRVTPKRLPFLQIPAPGETVNNLCLQTDGGVVDIISSVLRLGDFEALRANAELFEIDGKYCRLISLPDLIRAKEAMGREKDMPAAKELRAIEVKRTKGRSEPEIEIS